MDYFCERCGCEDQAYFVELNDTIQCRRCISYQGQEGELTQGPPDIDEHLSFTLTPSQNQLSQDLYEASLQGDVLVHAVCGAGKSELVLTTVSNYLSSHQKVGITVARRQVVLELAKRYQAIYPNLIVTPVCEGYTSKLSGDLIVCTSHQLYRFHKRFDCLIIDEPDAYPYASDPVLQGFAKQASKGVTIYLTATPSEKLRQLKTLTLYRRPHGVDLPVPQLHKQTLIFQILFAKRWMDSSVLPKLIFVPTKAFGHRLAHILKLPFAYAGKEGLDELLAQFKQGHFKALITTTVLERGLTFENVQVLILDAQHSVFNEASLIQIAGRVGRSTCYPTGEVHFCFRQRTPSIHQCVQHIQSANCA